MLKLCPQELMIQMFKKFVVILLYRCGLSNSKNWLDEYVRGLIGCIVRFLRALNDYGGSKLVEEAYGIVLHTYIIERQDRSITETLEISEQS
jgi:hypothetical protein